jgi:hypothetical protein
MRSPWVALCGREDYQIADKIGSTSLVEVREKIPDVGRKNECFYVTAT